ncbi:hypothetical protein ZHAS_00017381 [Anopheles sinensis]|uniref:Uncharacterized protein n=1 Tax=Anopheles sinensis TaxID=74873 RepID=A0A084WGC5_ANOSI|nr:hypothetical protein ZHAS_00017381 [Anopheles sinensis]
MGKQAANRRHRRAPIPAQFSPPNRKPAHSRSAACGKRREKRSLQIELSRYVAAASIGKTTGVESAHVAPPEGRQFEPLFRAKCVKAGRSKASRFFFLTARENNGQNENSSAKSACDTSGS